MPLASALARPLEQRGLNVDFRAFDGRHEIPRDVRSALPDFLFGS